MGKFVFVLAFGLRLILRTDGPRAIRKAHLILGLLPS